METIEILGKTFQKLVDEKLVEQTVLQAKNTIDEIQRTNSDVVFVVMANGANWFAQKIFNFYSNKSLHIEYARLKSYFGTEQSDIQFIAMPHKEDIAGKTIIVLEDILDSGNTMSRMENWLKEHGANQTFVIALCQREGNPISTANQPMQIAKGAWVVGCGMDYNHEGRNFNCIYAKVN